MKSDDLSIERRREQMKRNYPINHEKLVTYDSGAVVLFTNQKEAAKRIQIMQNSTANTAGQWFEIVAYPITSGKLQGYACREVGSKILVETPKAQPKSTFDSPHREFTVEDFKRFQKEAVRRQWEREEAAKAAERARAEEFWKGVRERDAAEQQAKERRAEEASKARQSHAKPSYSGARDLRSKVLEFIQERMEMYSWMREKRRSAEIVKQIMEEFNITHANAYYYWQVYNGKR
jgi:hypothetical protein